MGRDLKKNRDGGDDKRCTKQDQENPIGNFGREDHELPVILHLLRPQGTPGQHTHSLGQLLGRGARGFPIDQRRVSGQAEVTRVERSGPGQFHAVSLEGLDAIVAFRDDSRLRGPRLHPQNACGVVQENHAHPMRHLRFLVRV